MTRTVDNRRSIFAFEILHVPKYSCAVTDIEIVQLLVVRNCVDFNMLCYFAPYQGHFSSLCIILKIVKQVVSQKMDV